MAHRPRWLIFPPTTVIRCSPLIISQLLQILADNLRGESLIDPPYHPSCVFLYFPEVGAWRAIRCFLFTSFLSSSILRCLITCILLSATCSPSSLQSASATQQSQASSSSSSSATQQSRTSSSLLSLQPPSLSSQW